VTIDGYANLIREDVYADFLKMYNNEEFEKALYLSDNGNVAEEKKTNETIRVKGKNYVISKGSGTSSLMDFVSERYDSVIKQLEQNDAKIDINSKEQSKSVDIK